jgi:hypothetical protein
MGYGIASINLFLCRSVKGNVFLQYLPRTVVEVNQYVKGAKPDVKTNKL